MVANQLSYQQSLLALLPQGSAWLRDDDTALARLMMGLAEEFARIDARAQQLIDESLPSAVNELLTRWENDYELPDSCSASVAQTHEDRRAALEQKYKLYGSQSREFLISLCNALGVTTSIAEYKESVFGEDVGGYFYGTDWMFVIEFDIIPNLSSDQTVAYAILECTMQRLVHAHKFLIFDYDNIPAGALVDSSAYLMDGLAYIIDSAFRRQ